MFYKLGKTSVPIFDSRGQIIQIAIKVRRQKGASCTILKLTEKPYRKALVTVSLHHIAIIKMWLNKAIINFN